MFMLLSLMGVTHLSWRVCCRLAGGSAGALKLAEHSGAHVGYHRFRRRTANTIKDGLARNQATEGHSGSDMATTYVHVESVALYNVMRMRSDNKRLHCEVNNHK
jgi:hypothetical protein